MLKRKATQPAVLLLISSRIAHPSNSFTRSTAFCALPKLYLIGSLNSAIKMLKLVFPLQLKLAIRACATNPVETSLFYFKMTQSSGGKSPNFLFCVLCVIHIKISDP